MIDHLIGRPSPSWKRTQVFLVLFFWIWRIARGGPRPSRARWLLRLDRALRRFSPWQVIASTLTAIYAVHNFDQILGLSAPEPLANLYSPSYYRATWIATGLDAGFATAMSIRPKWFRDICSIIFSLYYIVCANAADEKLRRFRAVPTVEMLRVTWEKTTNPYIRLLTHLPRLSVHRKIHLPRPKGSVYERPITAYIFFAPPENQLSQATDLILDLPGGGFVAMNPEHHEERLRSWALTTGRPVLSVDYGKSPEYPYPFASDEVFDLYRLLVETKGSLIGMSGQALNIIVTGDSAGATLAVTLVVKMIENNQKLPIDHDCRLPPPIALVLNYAALDFNFTSWMSPDHLRVLRSEQSSGNIPGLKDLAAQKDHLQHVSPLSMVRDNKRSVGRKRIQRQSSWKDTLLGLTSSVERDTSRLSDSQGGNLSASIKGSRHKWPSLQNSYEDKGDFGDTESEGEVDFRDLKEEDRPLEARVRYSYSQLNSVPSYVIRSESALERRQEELSVAIKLANSNAVKAVGSRGVGKAKGQLGIRLTMTSRTGYFQDRIISPSMMRAMAILYIGPRHNPDFATDYYISPILAPAPLLAQFPPLLMQCGEKDPFVDDTVIFAHRVREAKRARKVELDLLLSGKSARFGEGLPMPMSATDLSMDAKEYTLLRHERDKLSKQDDMDWVETVIYSEWSHGYLQMPTILPEAKAVIAELGQWISESFDMHRNTRESPKNQSPVRKASPTDTEPFPDLGPQTPDADMDEAGITFSTRKNRLDSLSNGSSSRRGSSSLGSDVAIGAWSSEKGLSEEASQGGERGGFEQPQSGIQTPDSHKSGGRHHGQTISEIELLRRRRLLDSHIFG